MLAKCANPSCPAVFRYLHQGELCALPSTDEHRNRSSRVNFFGFIPNAQYAWLCDHCVKHVKVILDKSNRIQVISGRWNADVIAAFALLPCLASYLELTQVM